MIWPLTILFFLGLQSGLAWLRQELATPWVVPDLDLLLVLVLGLFARRRRVTVLLVCLAGTRAILAGTPLAAALAVYLATGWALVSSRHLLFRNRLPGRLLFAFLALGLQRLLLAGLDNLGRNVPWPPLSLWLAPAALTALIAAAALPVICHLPPISFHLERSRE